MEREVCIPNPRSQGGRRLFVLRKSELLLDMNHEFHRWLLRGTQATPAGRIPIDKAWYRGELEADDIGAYELIEGSYEGNRFALWFTGRKLTGEWLLEKVKTKWTFRPAK